MNFIELKDEQYKRIFVVGSIEGDYYKLINFLFQQFFSYKDILILTGNCINLKEENSNKIIDFLRNNDNCFSVKGFNEKEYLNAKDGIVHKEHFDFISKMPETIKVLDYLSVSTTLDKAASKTNTAFYCFSEGEASNELENSYNLGSTQSKLYSFIYTDSVDPILIEV